MGYCHPELSQRINRLWILRLISSAVEKSLQEIFCGRAICYTHAVFMVYRESEYTY